MPGLRPAGAALLALVPVFVAGTLPAAAVAPAVAVDGVLDAPVPISFLFLDAAGDAPVPPPDPSMDPYCRRASFVADEPGRRFTFWEGTEENGCLRVAYNVTLPAGTARFDLVFEANRSVQQGLSGLTVPDMVQSVRLAVAGGFNQEQEVFDADAGSRPREAARRYPFDVPAGARAVQVQWVFRDQGGPGRLQAFSATVWDPAIHFEAIPLPAPELRPGPGEHRDGEYVAQYALDVAVPAEFAGAAAAGQFSIRMQVDAMLRQVGVDGSGGAPLAEPLYSVLSAGGRTTLELPAATLRDVPGPYTVHLYAHEPLQRQGAFQALAAAALAAPAAAIAAAWFGLRRGRRGGT